MAEGIIVRLTHGQPPAVGSTPAVRSSILIDDIFDPTRPGTRQPVYVPYGTLGNPGSVDITLTSAVARSMDSGCIAGHKTRGNILVEVINGDAHGDAVGQVIRVPFVVSPGNTINEIVWVPTACRVLSIQAYIEQVAVTAGNYTLAVQHGPDAGLVNLLSAATFDLTTLAAQTITSIGLTATSANRNLAASRRIRFQVVSSNGDLVGAGLTFALRYGLR